MVNAAIRDAGGHKHMKHTHSAHLPLTLPTCKHRNLQKQIAVFLNALISYYFSTNSFVWIK